MDLKKRIMIIMIMIMIIIIVIIIIVFLQTLLRNSHKITQVF